MGNATHTNGGGTQAVQNDAPVANEVADAVKPISATDIINTPVRRRGGWRASETNASEADGGQFGTKLYWWDECPAVLKYNKYIRSGYRAGMTYKQCWCSVVKYHNETGNIWTHGAPLLLLWTAMLAGWLVPWPTAHAEFFQSVLPVSVCLMGSVCYHTCMARHQHYRGWLLTDVCGVFVLLLGGAKVLLTLGWPCYMRVANGFLVTYYVTGVVAVVAALRGHSPAARAMPMLLLFIIRLASYATRAVLQSGSRAAVVHYLAMECWSVIGAVINAMRIPEKWFQPKDDRTPGIFDYWLNSHQIMHLFALGSLVHMHLGAFEDYKYAIATHRQCAPGVGW